MGPSLVASIRRVSRFFNDIATPIFYRHITLNGRLVAVEAQVLYSRSLVNIFAHTKHVAITSDTRPEAASRILERIEGLLSVTYVQLFLPTSCLAAL